MFTTPILYSDGANELKSLQLLARETFLSRTVPEMTVHDVFPNLVQLVESSGLQLKGGVNFSQLKDQESIELEKLAAYIERAFQIAPFSVRSLLQATPPIPPGNQVQEQEITYYKPTPLPGANQSITDTPSHLSKSGSDRAYELSQALQSKVALRIIGEVVYHFDGTHYAFLSPANLRRLIMKHCRADIEREGNGRLIEAIYKLLLCEPQLSQKNSHPDPRLLSCSRGVYNLDTHQIYPHNSRFDCFYTLTGHPLAGPHPIFDNFVDTITGGDESLQRRVLEVIGYCLVPDLGAKSFFVFQGVPDSGKSVLAGFIQRCFNPEAFVATEIGTLSERFAVSSLIGKHLCLAMDMPSTPLNAKAVSSFKMLTGGDPITADIKYLPQVTFLNTAKFILGTNHPLYTSQTDYAFERRAVTIPFMQSIPREIQDHNLPKKLDSEKDFIIFSALQAYDELKDRKYQFSGDFQLNELFEGHSSNYPFSSQAMLTEFIVEQCDFDSSFAVFIQELYIAFCDRYPTLNIAQNDFSFRFLRECKNQGKDVSRGSKKRITPDGNPQATVIGVRLRQSVLEEANHE